MKNPILALLAILALICSGLLYAAPTLRDRRANANVTVEGDFSGIPQGQPQVRVEGAPPATIGQPPAITAPRIEGENPIVPPPITAPKKEGPIRRILPPYQRSAPKASGCCPPMGQMQPGPMYQQPYQPVQPQYQPAQPQYQAQPIMPGTTMYFSPTIGWGDRYSVVGPNIFHPNSTVIRMKDRRTECCPAYSLGACISCMECY